MTEVAGQVVSGSFGNIVVRQKSSTPLELGQLLTANTVQGTVLLAVYELVYGSQLSLQSRELIAGMQLELPSGLEMMDSEIRNYTLAYLKPLLLITDSGIKVCKTLPHFFSQVNYLEAAPFLERPDYPLLIGKLRSGSRTLDTPVFLNGRAVFSHHVLIAAQTGRGKSNLMNCLLASALQQDYAGFLVLDPHDEYYGRNKRGLKELSNIVYYTPNSPPPGTRSLTINLAKIRPSHFNGAVFWSEPQQEALYAFYRKYKTTWIEALFLLNDEQLKQSFAESTISVVKRRLMQLLSIEVSDSRIYSKGIFDTHAGLSTVADIVDELEHAKAVIIDTSSLSSAVEILVGTIIASELFSSYQHYKATGELSSKPVVSVVLEEAPRVLGSDVLGQGPNIFSKIAREGRKFGIGLIAITQLPSVIPRQILANIGTKIILGLENAPERRALIESAAQDLSQDERAIAALDVGEAIVTSTFSKFAVPVKIPFFETLLPEKKQYNKTFPGLQE